MNTQMKTQQQRIRRAIRTRSNIKGTASRPRLSVTISNIHVSAQLIDDETGKSLAQCSSSGSKEKTMTDKAVYVGKQIAELAKKAKISEAIFDRGAKQFHGRVKAVADSARDAGLKV